MQVCPAGHRSGNPGICDVCGLPLDTAQQPADDGLDVDTAGARTRTLPAGPDPQGPSQAATTAIPVIPDSGAATTAIPVEEVRRSHAATTVLPDQPPGQATTVMPTDNPAATSVMPVTGPAPAAPASQAATEVFSAPPAGPPAPEPVPDPAVPPTGATALLGQGRQTHWHAVCTVDAAWYAVQDTPYQLPPEGRSTVVELTSDSATLGRRSRSRGTTPDIDCSTDPGVSRRHARFDLIDGRWYVEDLGSANGTYIAHAGAPLPEHPIAAGRRVEVGPGDTVYVGAWTRVSIADDDAWDASV